MESVSFADDLVDMLLQERSEHCDLCGVNRWASTSVTVYSRVGNPVVHCWTCSNTVCEECSCIVQINAGVDVAEVCSACIGDCGGFCHYCGMTPPFFALTECGICARVYCAHPYLERDPDFGEQREGCMVLKTLANGSAVLHVSALCRWMDYQIRLGILGRRY